MDWDKEKAMLEQISDCHKRVQWLAHQLSELVGPPEHAYLFRWECDHECKWSRIPMLTYGDACINCWIAASGRAVKKAKEDAPQA